MEVLVNFNSIMDNIIKQIDLKYIENNMLVSIRDTILPKLMSGEIRVPLEEDE
jgi:type I restriction enzyme S subunit